MQLLLCDVLRDCDTVMVELYRKDAFINFHFLEEIIYLAG